MAEKFAAHHGATALHITVVNHRIDVRFFLLFTCGYTYRRTRTFTPWSQPTNIDVLPLIYVDVNVSYRACYKVIEWYKKRGFQEKGTIPFEGKFAQTTRAVSWYSVVGVLVVAAVEILVVIVVVVVVVAGIVMLTLAILTSSIL